MARREKSGGEEGGPAWLITFSDLMTLLLTFFVLLVSMAVIDERNKLTALGSVSTSFGALGATSQFNPTSPNNTPSRREKGAMADTDLAPIRDMIWDEADSDLHFQENRYVQIISINGDVLFTPGATRLSERGKVLLDKMFPYLLGVRYPLLVAGHTANRRDEEAETYQVDLDRAKMDSTWPLSLARAQAVYLHLVGRGMPEARLAMEGFGQFRPRFPNRSPEGRLANRRVDIVLDKRNAPEILRLEDALASPPPPARHFLFRGFNFDLDRRPSSPGGR